MALKMINPGLLTYRGVGDHLALCKNMRDYRITTQHTPTAKISKNIFFVFHAHR